MTPRIVCVALYLLPSPLKWLAARGGNGQVWQHYSEAAALSFLLLAIMLSILPAFLLLSAVLFFAEKFFDTFHLDEVSNWSYLGLLAIWALTWMVGLTSAARGSRRPFPFLSPLGRRAWVRRTAAVSWTLFWAVAAVVVALTVHSTNLAGTVGGKPAEIYLLYDQGIAPPWLAHLTGYRLILAASDRWGKGAAVVAPITPESLDEALTHGRLLFLCTHGLQGRILVDGELLGPRELTRHAVPGKKLRLVYLTACDAGKAECEWRKALAPATVILFNRYSSELEHAFWLWFRAPGMMAKLD